MSGKTNPSHYTQSTLDIRAFQTYILSWWEKNKRDLPWRKTRNPYKIMVSEVMLQQTQVLRVIDKYEEFIQKFPDVHSLQKVKKSDVLKIWKGLGYNRRALYLYNTAKTIVKAHGGEFPEDEKTLRTLPGIGEYTARAILIFAYNKQIACIDTNIEQILTHYFFKGKKQKPSKIKELAEKLVPKGKSWEWHQALMDFNSMELKSKKSEVRSQNIEESASWRRKDSKKKIPFKETDRFFRGRVIDRLREGDIDESELLNLFSKKYKKPSVFLKKIIQGLEKDGLLVNNRGVLELPE